MNLNDLNKEQRLAAETLEGPLLVLAGAGSGKTRALTYRVANLLEHGVPPWSIMAITFTNKAAKEMRERIEKLAGDGAAEVWVSTFHSGCAKILRRDIEKLGYTRSFTIYDDDDQMSALKEILKRLNIDDKFLPPREIKSKISDAKNKLLGPQDWFAQSERDYRSQMVYDVYNAYEEKLKSSNSLDFDDLIVKTLELFAQHPPVLEAYQRKLRYIHVDDTRIRTTRSICLSGCWQRRAVTFAWSAMTISPYMAGAARISAISSILKRIFRMRRSSSWSRTTVRPRIFWMPPIR